MDLKKLLSKEKMLLLLLGGVLLFVICIPLDGGAEKKEETGESAVAATEQSFEESLNLELTRNLAEISGIGKVRVMITYSASEETVYEEGSGAFGGETKVVKTLRPKVQGVLVVAQGADVGRNNKIITDVCKALFGISEENVEVVKMR